jgi:hypothetical protein
MRASDDGICGKHSAQHWNFQCKCRSLVRACWDWNRNKTRLPRKRQWQLIHHRQYKSVKQWSASLGLLLIQTMEPTPLKPLQSTCSNRYKSGSSRGFTMCSCRSICIDNRVTLNKQLILQLTRYPPTYRYIHAHSCLLRRFINSSSIGVSRAAKFSKMHV